MRRELEAEAATTLLALHLRGERTGVPEIDALLSDLCRALDENKMPTWPTRNPASDAP